MTMKMIAPIALALAVAGCVAPTYDVGYDGKPMRRIASAAEFEAAVVGKRLSSRGVTLVIRPNGRVTGSGQAGRVSLNWSWRGPYYCRSGSVGGIQVEEDCEVVLTSGNSVQFVSNRGRGQGVEYRIR